jgi:hypothetical protein
MTLALLLQMTMAQAGTIYTIEAGTDTLYAYDTLNDSFTSIGNLGFDFDWGSMVWDPVGQAMYLVHARGSLGLYRINLRTGAATFIGNHNLSDMFGAAFDPNTGYIYGGSFGTWFAIDPATARTRVAGAVSVTFSGLDYLPPANLYVGNSIGAAEFHSVDILTGTTRLLGNANLFINDVGMAWDDDTGLLHGFDYSANHFAFDPANNFSAMPTRSIGFGSWDGAETATGVAANTLQVTQGRCPGNMTFQASDQTPLGNVAFGRGGAGQTIIPRGNCRGTALPVGNLQLVSIQQADPRGVATLTGNVPGGACGTGRLVAMDMTTCAVSNIVTP